MLYLIDGFIQIVAVLFIQPVLSKCVDSSWHFCTKRGSYKPTVWQSQARSNVYFYRCWSWFKTSPVVIVESLVISQERVMLRNYKSTFLCMVHKCGNTPREVCVGCWRGPHVVITVEFSRGTMPRPDYSSNGSRCSKFIKLTFLIRAWEARRDALDILPELIPSPVLCLLLFLFYYSNMYFDDPINYYSMGR